MEKKAGGGEGETKKIHSFGVHLRQEQGKWPDLGLIAIDLRRGMQLRSVLLGEGLLGCLTLTEHTFLCTTL